MLKVNNNNTRKNDVYLSNVFVVNFEHSSHRFLKFIFLHFNKYLLGLHIVYWGEKSS